MTFPARFICLALCLGAAAALPAAPLEELVNPASAGALLRGGRLAEVQLSNPVPKLAPVNGQLRYLMGMIAADVRPTMMVENLVLYRKPAGADGSGWTEAERTALYNQALALSTLTGLQYYSSSRKAMRTFYESSRIIDGPDSRRPLEDPVFAEPPERLVLYARQKDLTFGDNIYRYECHAGPEAIIVVQENISPLNMGIVPAIGRGRLRSVVAVLDSGPWLLLYTFSLARAASFPGLGGRIGASFTTRVEAVSDWFAGRADRAFAGAEPGPDGNSPEPPSDT